MPVTTEPGKWRQGEQEFGLILDFIARYRPSWAMLKPNLKIQKTDQDFFLAWSGAGWKLYMVCFALFSLIC